MESGRATTKLCFCEECGALRLRDVKDQLQKLFTDKSTKRNVCGICLKCVDIHDETVEQSRYAMGGSGNEVIKKPKEVTQMQAFVAGNGICAQSTDTSCYTSGRSNKIKTETGVTDSESNHTSGHKVTRLSTGAIQAQRYGKAVGDSDDDDEDEYDYDDCDYDSNSDNNVKTDIKRVKLEPSEHTDADRTGNRTAGIAPELLQLMTPTDDHMLPFKCKFCDVLPFRKLVAFLNHVQSHTGQAPTKKPYQCDVCAKRFSRPVNLSLHQVTHATFECTIEGCEFTFNNDKDLKTHLQVHSGEIPLQCGVCVLGFELESSLTAHQTLQLHSGTQTFPCTFCDRTFCQKPTLQAHERSHANKGRYKCKGCSRVFKYKKMLTRHVKAKKNTCWVSATVPSTQASVAVPEGAVQETDMDLSEITRWINPRVIAMMDKPTSINMPFKCKQCKSREWKNPNMFLKHMRDQHPDEPVVTHSYACDLCDQTFGDRHRLRLHHVSHTGNKPFKCPRDGCDKTFSTLTYLNGHQKYMHETKKHMCSVCGKQFVNNNKLKKHEERVHLKLRPWLCEHCGHGFSAKDKRDVHVRRIHRKDNKAFICETCGRRFAIKEELRYHTRTHTGEKPYSCELCDYRCARPDYLRKHRRTHTGEKPYQCKHCEMRFSNRSSLVLHERRHLAAGIEKDPPPADQVGGLHERKHTPIGDVGKGLHPDQVVDFRAVQTAHFDVAPDGDELRYATENIAIEFVQYTS